MPPDPQPIKLIRFATDPLMFRQSPYELPSIPPQASPDSKASPHPPFILVLERSITLCTIIDVTLRRLPQRMGWALYSDALEALKDIHLGRLPVPDIALIQQDVPRMSSFDGIEVTRLMRARGYHTTIVLLVNQDRSLVRLKARLAGAHVVLVKPFKTQELIHLFLTVCAPPR